MTKLPKIYLSGQMGGLPDHGFPLFNTTAKTLRDKGYNVVNPAENGAQGTWEDYLKLDLTNMLTCDGVAVLTNWKNSRGARLEVYVAQALSMPVYSAENMQLLPEENVLEEALRLVGGDRQGTYGHPYDDYKCTTDMFNTWKQKKYGTTSLMTPEDATMFMVFVKLSREANLRKRDNLVDAAGYLLCYDMVLKRGAL